MNKAIIICVLSLSLCLTQAAPSTDHSEAAETPPLSEPAEKTNDVKIVTLPSDPTEKSATVPKTDTKDKDIKPQEKADTKTEEAKAIDNKTENKAQSAVPEAQKPTEKPAEKSADIKPAEKSADVKPTEKTADEKHAEKTAVVKPAEKPTEVKPAEKTTDVKPAEKPTDLKPETTTQVVTKATEAGKDVTVKPTESPKDSVTEKPVETKRGFDGPRFIGGIILTLGLLAIGFMGLKYYKNQTERNYHTL